MENIIKPYPHQEEILERSKTQKSLALLWDMGSGKTFATINMIRQRLYENQGMMKILILTPQVTLFNWKEEFKKFSKIPPECIWLGNQTGKKRVEHLRTVTKVKGGSLNRPCIYIVNWEALGNEDIMDSLLEWQPEIIVGDELHLIKNYKAKRAIAAVKLADKTRRNGGYIYGLTGTAILNSVADIYMQYRFLDGGKRFGENFFVFRNKYMFDANASWSNRPGHYASYEPRIDMFEELNQKIYEIATKVTKEECMKHLPPLIKIRREVKMSPEQSRMYKEMKNDFITFVAEKKEEGVSSAVVANLAITKALRLMQIVSGFAVDEEGVVHEIKNNPRLAYTQELVEEITANNKVILWCSFKNNYKQLGKMCEKLEIGHVYLTGQMSASEKQEAMHEFQNNPETRVIIANRRAGGIGVNLTAAAYSIVFSRNFSLGEERQSEARNHRGGSEVHEKIIKIDLIAEKTIDEVLLAALEGKQDLAQAVLAYGGM